MKENQNNDSKTQKKRMAWMYTLFTVLVFAPTVVIIIILMIQNADGAANNETTGIGSESGLPSLTDINASGWDGNIPTMMYNGEKVSPLSASFYFRAEDGATQTLATGGTLPTSSVTSSNKFVLISFDMVPDECAVSLYDGDKTVFSGSPQTLSEYHFAGYDYLVCNVFAKWNDRKASVCGNATYKFGITFGGDETDMPSTETEQDPADLFECSLDDDTLFAGDYTVLRMRNVDNMSNVTVSFSPETGFAPVFAYLNGEYCAIIPTSADLPESTYFISVEYYGRQVKLEYTVKARAYKERTYDASETLIKISRSAKALEEYQNIKSVIDGIESYTADSVDSLGDYSKTIYSDSNIYLGYGYYRKLCDGTGYRMDGVDYRLSEGSSVVAVAKGKVIYTGYSQYLGYFVVVDHGCGVRTWYSHLSVITTSENRTVNAGDSIGFAGKTGFTTTCGVYVMCTVDGVCVSPYRLIECGMFGVRRGEEYDGTTFG